MKSSCVIFLVTVSWLATIANGHREHKVHNIVLYPDKHSWCKTLAIKQVISYPDCKSEEIDNNVCVGACFSYSIPHTEPSDPGEVIVPYCDSCQPSDTTWHHVTLECTKNNPETPPQLVKRVQIINNCSCTSCEKNQHSSLISTASLSSSSLSSSSSPNEFMDDEFDTLMMQNNDVPDLLNFLNNRNETFPTVIDSEHTKKIRSIMNHKILTLLKNIQEYNSQNDKEQLMDLLKVVQGPNQKISDKGIADFVDSLNTENIQLDIPRLREILIKFEHSKFYEKHHKKYFDNNNNNDGDGGVDVGGSDDDNQNQNIEIDGIEGSHYSMGHLKGSHIGMGIVHHNQNQHQQQQQQPYHHHHNQHHHQQLHHHHHHHHHHENDKDIMNDGDNGGVGGHMSEVIITNGSNIDNIGGDNNYSKNTNHQNKGENNNRSIEINEGSTSDSSSNVHHGSKYHHHHQQQQQQQQHHHIGENIIGHGHLTRGPHGALVIEPDRILHEKLDVNPHELKPNHAGTLLSYSSHSTDKSKNLD